MKKKGFWTRPRKDFPRVFGTIAFMVVFVLATSGWFTVALFAAIALGGVVALFLRWSRPKDSL